MTQATGEDPVGFPIGWIRWRPAGQLNIDENGDLVFPPVAAVPGIYRFMIDDGTGVVAGYIGQAKKSLAKAVQSLSEPRKAAIASAGKKGNEQERPAPSRRTRC